MGFHDMDDIIGHEGAKAELKEHWSHPSSTRTCSKPWGSTATVVSSSTVRRNRENDAWKGGCQPVRCSIHGRFRPRTALQVGWRIRRAVRELFQRAQEAAPVVLFFDEFDALGRQRDGGDSSAHSNSVVAQLDLMDGLGSNEDIYLMASTNQIDLVDRAFLRPGRFDRAIYVGPLEKQHYNDFFANETKDCLSDVSEMNGRRSSSNWWTRRPVQNCTVWSTPPSETRFPAPLPTGKTWPCSNTETSSLLSLRCHIFSLATLGTF